MVVAVILVAVLAAGFGILRNPFKVDNPFRSETKYTDHSSLLVDLRDVSRFEAATGQFQVLVDVEKDVRYVPSFLAGEHVTFVAEGDVNAVVDFSDLSEGAVKVSKDGKSVTITLPDPTLSKPRIDPDNTRVMSSDKGVANRVGDAVSGKRSDDQPLYKEANRKIARAASQSELISRARTNTKKMLKALLKDLGYDDVTIIFRKAPGP